MTYIAYRKVQMYQPGADLPPGVELVKGAPIFQGKVAVQRGDIVSECQNGTLELSRRGKRLAITGPLDIRRAG